MTSFLPMAVPPMPAVLDSPVVPQRIVLVTETWPPEINGVAHSICQLVHGLQQHGHHLLLIRPRQKQESGQTPQPGTQHAPCPPYPAMRTCLVPGFAIPRYPLLQGGWPAYRQVVQAIRSFQPDLVHIVTEGPLGLAALLAARRQHIVVTSGYHSPFHAFSDHFQLRWMTPAVIRYLRWFHDRTSLTMVPSQATSLALQQMGIRCPLHVVGRGVDTTLFHPAHRDQQLRQHWGADDQTTVLAYVGRLSPEKGLLTLATAYDALRQQQPGRHIRLVLVGDGPQAEALRMRLPDAHFAGMRTGTDLAAHYASTDAFLFASQVETFGNVVPEALASGLPVWAYQLASAAQLVTSGVNGQLATPDNPSEFIRLISQLPELASLHAMRIAAREAVSALGWSQAVGQMEQAFIRAQRLAAVSVTSNAVYQS